MCIIATKQAGQPLPTSEQFENCGIANPDGCGLAVVRGNTVQFSKGFAPEGFEAVAREAIRPADVAVLHWRFETHGGKTPGLTHPFPVAEHLETLTATEGTAQVAFAHNGILSDLEIPKGFSDTAAFARLMNRTGILHKGRYEGGRIWQELLEGMITGSRLAVLWRTGQMQWYGYGWSEDNAGLWWSNTGHERTYTVRKYLPDYRFEKGTGYVSGYSDPYANGYDDREPVQTVDVDGNAVEDPESPDVNPYDFPAICYECGEPVESERHGFCPYCGEALD
jgi:hypothetical protein